MSKCKPNTKYLQIPSISFQSSAESLEHEKQLVEKKGPFFDALNADTALGLDCFLC